MGRKGMVCSGHYLASLAGMRALLAGGNAVDAAIATAAALGLVEPHMSGPGGDGFLMVHWKGAERSPEGVYCIDGTGRAPGLAARERFLDGGIPYKGIRSVSIPGLVAGWCLAHERFGSLPLEQVFAPAAELAREGFPVSPKLAAVLVAEAEADSPLFRHPPSAAVFAPEGRPLRAGELMRNPGYALTLAAIARGGAAAFYQGDPARAILELSHTMGGCFTPTDLAEHQAYVTEPIRTDYRGYTVCEFPPPSSGHVLLQELNLVERFDLRSLGRNSAAAIHLMVEAKKLAFADRERYVADPERLRIPLKGLLSKEYAAVRAERIDPARAAPLPPAGQPEQHEDTTCFCTADGWGNAVCQLQSIQSGFGSGLVAGDTGVLLNNRMTYWHLEPDHPNALAPGKRVRHTMNPVMVFDGPDRILVCGTPGADTQLQTNLQVLTHLLDFGLDPQEAVEAPRWRHIGDGTESEFPHRSPDRLLMEERFDAEVRRELAAMGHPLETIGPWAAMGSEQVIQQDARTGTMVGGSDPRRDGCALAW
jgi:gamma-glutamyltranspeptidase/glutathione hydrolase